GRNALLDDIQKGKRLKKAITNDRSSPIIEGSALVGLSNKGRARSSSTSGGSGVKTAAAPPALGGLFAGGMPKLKNRGGIDTGRDNNNLAAPPPLPGGRPRAPSDGKQVSVAVQQSKGEAQFSFRNTIQKSIGKPINSETTTPPSLPNRTTPNVPPLPTRAKTNAVPPQIPNRTQISNSTSSIPPLPSRNTKSATPPPPAVKKVPPPTPNKPSSLTSSRSAPQPPSRSVSTMQQSHSPSLQPPQPPRARSPGFAKSIPSQKEPPTTEGRWTFHPSSDFPNPRPIIKSIREYPSGASSGTIPLDLSSLTLQGTPQRAPPPPPMGRAIGRR
ncbi:12052_t:CDS:2, partial [Funneliformis geosporum]